MWPEKDKNVKTIIVYENFLIYDRCLILVIDLSELDQNSAYTDSKLFKFSKTFDICNATVPSLPSLYVIHKILIRILIQIWNNHFSLAIDWLKSDELMKAQNTALPYAVWVPVKKIDFNISEKISRYCSNRK